jgi:hypothetical protein
MKALGIVLSLVRFHLRVLPLYIWPLLAVILLLQAQITSVLNNQWTLGGPGNTTHLFGPGFFSFILLASAFCGARAGYTGGLIPAGEFLLSRSVLRRTAYFSRMALYFTIILAAPLLEVYLASTKPDLRIEFFDTSTQGPSADASARQRFYQDQFPESTVAHETKSVGPHRTVHYDALVIPSGAFLIARWDLFAAIILALTLQIGMFFASSSKVQSETFYRMFSAGGTVFIIYFIGSVVIDMVFPQFNSHTTLFEHAFFFFAHRGFLLTVFALEAFVFVQWIALKRIKHFEVM